MSALEEVTDDLKSQWLHSGSSRQTAQVKEEILEAWPQLYRAMESLVTIKTRTRDQSAQQQRMNS